MSFYRGMTCENVTLKGHTGTPITAYTARPAGPGPHPGVVLIHHLPGWSELYIETTRRFAHHGYLAICANLYEREGGSDANPDDVAAKVRAEGGVPDAQVVGDTNVELPTGCGVVPGEIDLFVDIFAGGSTAGTICFVVPADAGQLVLYATVDYTKPPVMFATT